MDSYLKPLWQNPKLDANGTQLSVILPGRRVRWDELLPARAELPNTHLGRG